MTVANKIITTEIRRFFHNVLRFVRRCEERLHAAGCEPSGGMKVHYIRQAVTAQLFDAIIPARDCLFTPTIQQTFFARRE